MSFLFIFPLFDDVEYHVVTDEGVTTQTTPKGSDFEQIPETILSLIDTFDIHDILVVTGPGAFTRMRILTLTLNTLTFTRDIRLKPLHFFDLMDPNTTRVLRMNPSEWLIRSPGDEADRVIDQDGLMAITGTLSGIGVKNDFAEGQLSVEYQHNWENIRSLTHETVTSHRLSPLYLKAPKITLPS